MYQSRDYNVIVTVGVFMWLVKTLKHNDCHGNMDGCVFQVTTWYAWVIKPDWVMALHIIARDCSLYWDLWKGTEKLWKMHGFHYFLLGGNGYKQEDPLTNTNLLNYKQLKKNLELILFWSVSGYTMDNTAMPTGLTL